MSQAAVPDGYDCLKKKPMKSLKKVILFSALLLAAYCQLPTALAQGPGFDEEVEDTPIDGGVTLVMAAAAAYGIKKLKRKAK